MAQVTKRSKEEMAKLWEEYGRTRDLKTKNILSEEYLPIVRYVAEKMIERLPHNVQVEDLVSAGVFGLFDAVDRFDMARGVIALVLGYLVGRLIFGLPGLSIVREAAGSVPPSPPAPGDSKPEGASPEKAPPAPKAS